MYRYNTSDLVCSQSIDIDLDEEGKVKFVRFNGGCPGNAAGVAALVVGMTPQEVIDRLGSIRCGGKPTSCPAELASALKKISEMRKKE